MSLVGLSEMGLLIAVLIVLGLLMSAIPLLEKVRLVQSAVSGGVPGEYTESEPRILHRLYKIDSKRITLMEKAILFVLFVLTVVTVFAFDGYLLGEGSLWLSGYLMPLELALLVYGIPRLFYSDKESTD